MCISFFFTAIKGNLNPRTKFRVIVATNRDEQLDRDTDPASWSRGILAGRDKTPGKVPGTWLGMDRKGRVGILTNIFTGINESGGKGRGNIVMDFLNGEKSAKEYLGELNAEEATYNPFNICLLEPDAAQCYETTVYTRGKPGHVVETSKPRPVEGQFHGLSNSPMELPFNKTRAGTKQFQAAVEEFNTPGKEAELEEAILKVLCDPTTYAPDAQMELQGPPDAARTSVFVDLPDYGTRMQSLIFIDNDGQATFVERTRSGKKDWLRVEHKFTIHVNNL